MARTALAVIAVCVLATVFVPACSGRRPMQPETSQERLVWPPAPAQPRIEFVRSFRNPRELGIRPNWLKRFVSYLVRGRRRHEMIRPYAVASTPDGLIAVADPDARSVHLYDLERRRYRRVTRAQRELLGSPVGLAIDLQSRIYVSDSHRAAIFRFDRKGKWIDSFGEGELGRPAGLAYDPQRDRVYVVDALRHQVHVYSTDGRRLASFGKRGVAEGEFNYPVAIAVGHNGQLYVSDSMNFRVQTFDPSGQFVSSFGKPGRSPGDFDKAKGIATDPDGHIYVVEGLHDVVHVYDRNGRLLTVVGGTGTDNGQFWLPAGITIEAGGRIFVADSANHRVQIFRYLGEPDDGDEG